MPSAAAPAVTIHTDGSCLGNPGPGGYGVILDLQGNRKELSGGYARTTNNRMELLAAITGLEALNQPCRVVLYSDSRYVIDGMDKGWAARWRKNGWMRNKREPAVNPDLWQRLLDLCDEHTVEFRWVRGHSGNADNERCDRLAREAAASSDLAPDPGYASGGRARVV
jgi:ribonuclease HI